jgi:hypothetical protein
MMQDPIRAQSHNIYGIIYACSLYYKTFYGRNCCRIEISCSVNQIYLLPSWYICGPAIRAESYKRLHSGRPALTASISLG